jgi:hypothetical protein
MNNCWDRVNATMKQLNLFLLISFFCVSTAFAFECNVISPYDVVVSLPFKDQSVSNGEYSDGICFSYKLNQSSPKKVICELSQFEAGWLVYFENSLLRTSDGTFQQDFKDNATVIITSKGESKIISKNVFQLHVDDNEVVAFHHMMSREDSPKQPQATCRYEDEA